MPVLSLPLPRFGLGVLEHFPLRVPFPFMRIASILPQSINEPFKASLLALFKLAWSAKLQIPVLITVVFMACDIRLQLEINIIWEANNRPTHANRIGIDRGVNRNPQRRASGEDMRRAALVAAAIYQQQRRRLIQEIRAQQTRQREVASRRRSLTSAIPPAAPLAVEEDSDLDCSHNSDVDIDESDSDTICSQRSTTSEAGMLGSDEVDTEDAEDNQPARKKKMKKRSRPSSREPDDDDNDDEDEDTSSDEDEDDDDDDFRGGGGGGGANGGSGSSHFGGGGGRHKDDSYDHDSDDMGDDNSNDESGTYSSPLVVEVEIRHRSLFTKNEFQMSSLRILLPFMRKNSDKSRYFSQYYKGFPSVYETWRNGFALMPSPFHHI